MTTGTSTPASFGFKRLTSENWLAADPVWQHFSHPPFADPATAWADDVLKHELTPAVPLPLRKMFEVGRGALMYGFLFYPLLTLGTDQLFRVLEAAINAKCEASHAPARVKRSSEKLNWLAEKKHISEAQHKRWDTARLLRNHSTHARDQYIYDPTMASDMLRLTVELTNELFRPE